MKLKAQTSLSTIAGACMTLVTACPVFAQTAPRTPETDDSSPFVLLEEYNVSSTRDHSYRAGLVQVGSFRDVAPVDVPVTINVVTREVIDAQGARTLFDALKNTAGVTRAQSNGNAADNIAIRGITVENRGNFRLNGTLPVVNLIDLTLENKERIEVLKGAASLYYGFVPPSGIINLVTKRATPEPLTVLTVSSNIHGGVAGHVDVSRRFARNNQVGIRVNMAAGKEELGIDHHSGERQFGSIAVDWKVSDRLLFRFDAEALEKETSEQANIRQLAAVNGVIPLPPVPPNTRNYGGEWQKNDAYMRAYVLRGDVILSRSWTIVAEVGHAVTHRSRHSSDFRNYNLTTGAGTLVTTFNPSMHYTNENVRVELFGRFDLAKMRHNFSVGYTFNERDAPVINNGNVSIPQNLFNPVVIPRPSPPTATSTLTHNNIEDAGRYVYDRMTMFDDRVQVIGGVRFTDFDSSTIVRATNNTTGVTTTTTTLYSVKNKFTPIASVAYKPTSKSSIYVSYLKGLEPGATAPFSAANSGFVLPPLESRQYEVGAKAEISGMLFQLAYFDIERPSAFLNPANVFTANGLASYKGVELFVTGEAGKHVSIIASGTVLNAEQLNSENAATFGKIPEGTAKYTGSLFAEWRVPQVKGLNLSAGAFYIGRRPLNDANQGFVGGYTTYSAGASYTFKSGKADWTIRINSDNLSDKNTWAGVGGALMSTLLPRMVKASVSVKF